MTPEETLLQLRSGYCAMFKVHPNPDADTNTALVPVLKHLQHLSQIPESPHETKHSHKRYIALFHAVQHIQRRLKLTLVSLKVLRPWITVFLWLFFFVIKYERVEENERMRVFVL